MPSSTQTTPKYSRRIKWLGIGIGIFIALYSGLWFWGASFAKDELNKALIETAGTGKTAKCDNLDIKGFPFRIGVFCDRVTYLDPSENISLTLGMVRSAAQIYNPMQGIVEIDGPLELSLPGDNSVRADWSMLHASAKIAQPLPKRFSLESKDFTLSLPLKSDKAVFKTENAQVHYQTVDQDIDLAASTTNMLIDPSLTGGRDIPQFNFDADIQLKNGVALATSDEKNIAILLRGQSGTIRGIGLNFTQGGGFKLSGPVALDDTGLINADLSISFSDAKKLGETIEKIAPEIASYVTPSLTLAASTAKAGEQPKIEMSIRKGKMAIGIFPLGQIPALQ